MTLGKEIRWIGSAYADLLRFPDESRRQAGFQLGKIQAGLEPDDWKSLDNLGSGVRELRIRERAGSFRVMYVAKFDEALYVPARISKDDARDESPGPRHRQRPISGGNQYKEYRQMTIDTQVRHVTPFGANLFLELGFAPAEATRLQAVSGKQIDDAKFLKEQLMNELASWIALHHLKQSDAARILMVSRPRVSDVVNKKTAKFTIDALVEMLGRTGQSVTLSVVTPAS